MKESDKLSFGWEQEYDVIYHFPTSDTYKIHGNDVSRHIPRPLNRMWIPQPDGTINTELSTRPFKKISLLVEKENKLWDTWTKYYPHKVPAFVGNGASGSIGWHKHIGRHPRNGMALTLDEKILIAEHIYNFYPLMVAIAANSPSSAGLSTRGLHRNNYATFVRRKDKIGYDHYGELSSSSHGTLECRRDDSNIIQVQLLNTYILKILAKGAFDGVPAICPFEGSYRKQIKDACTTGLKDIDANAYIQALFKNYPEQVMEISKEDEVPLCVKELLYMATQGINACNVTLDLGIFNLASPKKLYYYFKAMMLDNGNYYKNLEKLEVELPFKKEAYWPSMSELKEYSQNWTSPINHVEGVAYFIKKQFEKGYKFDAIVEMLIQQGERKEKAISTVGNIISFVATGLLPANLKPRYLPKEAVKLLKKLNPDVLRNGHDLSEMMEESMIVVDRLNARSADNLAYHLSKFGIEKLTTRNALYGDRNIWLTAHVVDIEGANHGFGGFIVFNRNEGRIYGLWVNNLYRRHGVATRLLEETLSYLSVKGKKEATFSFAKTKQVYEKGKIDGNEVDSLVQFLGANGFIKTKDDNIYMLDITNHVSLKFWTTINLPTYPSVDDGYAVGSRNRPSNGEEDEPEECENCGYLSEDCHCCRHCDCYCEDENCRCDCSYCGCESEGHE